MKKKELRAEITRLQEQQARQRSELVESLSRGDALSGIQG